MKPSKLAIAQSFSNAAVSYDQSAALQRMIGSKLLAGLKHSLPINSALDLGCGTGYFTKQLAGQFSPKLLLGLDIAEGMLQQANLNVNNTQWLVGDAERIPLKNNSVDMVFSNLALQWCHDFTEALSEVYRVLKPQGAFLFTTLCDGTLFELKQSWQQVDSYVHVNQFMAIDWYKELITHSPFLIEACHYLPEIAYYPSLQHIMADLKGIGAHNINPERSKGLTTRQQLLTLIDAYEQYRCSEGLPTTYQVLYGYLIKR